MPNPIQLTTENDLRLKECLESADGTKKYVWETNDGYKFESAYVFLEYRDVPDVICISSQIGCPISCDFCVTGEKFFRNLSKTEIHEQICRIHKDVFQNRDPTPFEISFMSMGEPLLNYDNVRDTIFNIERNFGTKCRVTISTVGVVPRIYELGKTVFPIEVDLQISLHSANPEVRKKLIPFQKYSINEIIEAGKWYAKTTGKKTCINYVLIEDINDKPEDCQDLIRLLDPKYFYVKLSQLNPGLNSYRQSANSVDYFKSSLSKASIETKSFQSRGTDVGAGCGQLSSKENDIVLTRGIQMENVNSLAKVQEYIRESDGLGLWASEDKPFDKTNDKEKRTLFKHDGDEIIYSAAFRRLSDKSQIVVKPEKLDHLRSRLTHTLEVNQIAESIGMKLFLNSQLINAIALGHDIGHTPFGHTGERELQYIYKRDVLPLCKFEDVRKGINSLYKDADISIDANGEFKGAHWLFHHALNSARIMERKLKGISGQAIDGVRTHSWSPWRSNSKFGIPSTYEGQVVAVADQVAGINHDTEDILTCKTETEYSPEKIYDDFPTYMVNKKLMTYNDAKHMLDEWFLKKGESVRESGWGRKYRLRTIINSIIDTTLPQLKKMSDNKSSFNALNTPIKIDKQIGVFLSGYEDYVRDEIIGKLSWFKQRDAQAAVGIQSVYSFYKNYIRIIDGDEKTNLPVKEIEVELEKFKNSADKECYSLDKHFEIFTNNALPQRNRDVARIIQIIDYVAGMTDRYLMRHYELAHKLFAS
jgi:23S rRNA (adenine2503-C2)-methyltransferase